MIETNSNLYRHHIISNINNLETRKNDYVHHRLQFLNQKFEPTRAHIEDLKNEIKYYENMRDTQHQVIESEEEIVQIKKEISEYLATNDFFEGKLDEFERSIFAMETHLNEKRKVLEQKKSMFKTKFNDSTEMFSAIKPFLEKSRVIECSPTNKSTIGESDIRKSCNVSSSVRAKSGDNFLSYSQKLSHIEEEKSTFKTYIKNKYTFVNISDRINTEETSKLVLPHISNNKINKKYYDQIQEKNIKRHQRNLSRLKKFISVNEKIERKDSNKNEIFEGEIEGQDIELTPSVIVKVKEAITQFDYTETLFKDCFERKKLLIQKSVSQLNSRLVSNKEIFLKVCEAVSEKSLKITFKEFCILTTDELTTLFISYDWLNRKIQSDFNKKRKNLISVLKMIKCCE